MKWKPKLCDELCIPVCDYCRMINYSEEGTMDYCVFHEKEVHLEDKCNDFICSDYAGEKGKKGGK